MKKLLFATTALIATASVAAAEVKFGGYGRFGIGYQEDRDRTTLTGERFEDAIERFDESGVDLFERGAEAVERFNEAKIDPEDVTSVNLGTIEGPAENSDVSDTILVSRFRLNIDVSTETDDGFEFWGRVRLQAEEDANTGDAQKAGLNGARFRVAYGGLTVEAGNVSGALDNLNNYYGKEPGLENFIGQYSGVNYSFLGYSSGGSGANAAYFQYIVDNFRLAASYDQNASVTAQEKVAIDDYVATISADVKNVDRWDVSATYTFENVTAALAYGENDLLNESLTVLTLGAEFDDFSGSLFLADDDVIGESLNGTAYGLSAAYNVGAATTLTFAYGDGSAESDTQQFGIGAIYDLGGGASLRGGIGQTKIGDGDGRMRADFGAQFNF